MYMALKHLHMTCVALSLLGFVVRGFWMMTEAPQLKAKLSRVLPHVVDTVLLGSAIALVSYYDAVPDWVWAKVVGLLIYIVLGTVALKRGKTRQVRIAAFVLALITFGWIVSVALSKSSAGFFA
ncbi:SirB2 family protein [Nitrogeniibacter aestuarii]|uniref:SirB2 family protein n=1 Tax=Nitrogeniibacter aestuarii TaxID=2815343 RepID=UPI001E4D7222|nr:SirB2 family protein [Nitrogeniibacter aestuarii]